MNRFFLFTLIVALSTNLNYSQQLAFPTAIGAGAYITGGRGQEVYHVSNLSSEEITGSFPWALKQAVENNGGTIVFDISGVIELTPNAYSSSGTPYRYYENLENGGIRNSRENINISVLGQTAPYPGITLDTSDANLRFTDLHNLIFRYIKFRNIESTGGLFYNQYVDNFIVDHCSFAWGKSSVTVTTMGSWGNWTIDSGYIPGDITVQNCLFTHGGRSVNVGNTAGIDGIFGDITMARNVFHEMGYRTPLKTGGTGQRDLINNIVSKTRNGKRISRFDNQGLRINHIGNSYTPSIVNIQDGSQGGVNDGNKIYTDNSTVDNFIYNYDNSFGMSIIPDSGTTGDIEKDFWDSFRPAGQENDPDIPDYWFVNTPHILAGKSFEIYGNNELEDKLLPTVGASSYIDDSGNPVMYRDAIDALYIDDIINDINRPIQTVIENRDVAVDYTSNLRPNNFYQSNPHIPEAYLQDRGIIGTLTIHNEIQPSGYTLIEEYANQVESNNETLSIPTLQPGDRFPIGYKFQMYNLLGQLVKEGKIGENTWRLLKEQYKGFYIMKIENGIVWKNIF